MKEIHYEVDLSLGEHITPCPYEQKYNVLFKNLKLNTHIIDVGSSYCRDCEYHQATQMTDSFVYCSFSPSLKDKLNLLRNLK